MSVIQKLPETNALQFFSLPLNVDLSWQKKRSIDIISWLKSNSKKILKLHADYFHTVTSGTFFPVLKRHSVETSNKLNIEEWKSKVSPILHLWKQLNQVISWQFLILLNRHLYFLYLFITSGSGNHQNEIDNRRAGRRRPCSKISVPGI